MTKHRANIRPPVRQAEICDLIDRRGKISVEVLAAKFDASQETIRRDLGVLADAGRIQKVHGGARRAQLRDEGRFEERMKRNALAKQLIAEKITKIVLAGQTIFMDTGSTTLACATALARIKRLTVITNSARIAAVVTNGTGGAEVFLLGGKYVNDNSQTVGPLTIREIEQYRPDHAIITIGALNESGAMDYSNDEAEVARTMIAKAHEVTVVVDHSKFGQRAAFGVCELNEIDHLVTDKLPGDVLLSALTHSNVEVV